MSVYLCGLLLLFDKLTFSAASLSTSSPPQDFVDCLRASEECNLSPQCSSRYRIIRQCLAGKDWNAMLANKECQAALEFLQDTPLVNCRCKRGMKREGVCLQNYWGIHMGLSEGDDFYEASPYEPMPPVHQSDSFRLAAIIAGMQSATGKAQTQCADPSRPCNACLDATKACNLDDNCKSQRTKFVHPCSHIECNKKRCHKFLRQFVEKLDSKYSFGLLFCPCANQGCAERRRQTIVPDCSYTDKIKPNCLELRRTCRSDSLCRSRLADFQTHCQMSPEWLSTCPNDNFRACLTSYVGLIGTDMTPNYEDANHTDFHISPWCSCKNSGNQEGECERFLQDFRENTCLRNAIQDFGMTDISLPIKSDSPVSTPSVNPRASPTANPNVTKSLEENCNFLKNQFCEEEKKDPVKVDWNGSNFSPSNRLEIWIMAWMLLLVSTLGTISI